MHVPKDMSVSIERINRIIDVVSVLSVGNLDPKKTHIEVTEEDDFAVLEHTLNELSNALLETRTQNQQAMEAVESSRKELEEKLATIEQQRTAIRDLSTPIIELWEDILTLPIVGIVDTQRSVEMTQRLLHRIVESRARCVIIDVTGVEVVDTMTANHFIKMVTSARLLGAYCVVTGISPNIAQTLTRIAVSFQEVPTLRSLKEGLRECFVYLRSKRGHRSDGKPEARANPNPDL